MTKLYYTSIFLLASFGANAQAVTIEHASMAPIGTTVPISAGSASGFNTGPNGVDQFWDYSSLTVLPAGNITVVDPATTPNAPSFPASNYAYKLDLTLPTVHTEYNYYNLSTTGMEMLGSEIGGGDPNDYTPNPRMELQFPWTFGMPYSDTYQTTMMTGSETVTRTFDAYGTLITPYGTYHNVARLAYTFDAGVTTNYQWLSTNPVLPLLTYNAENGTVIIAGLSTVSAVAGNDVQRSNFFPTLITDGTTFLSDASSVQSVNVFDALGRCVMHVSNPTSGVLDMSSLSKGFYFANVTDNKGNSSVSKLTIQ